MPFNISHYGLIVFSLIFATYTFASSTDTQQPITIEADRAELDEQKEISVYLGNVVLQQGGIQMKADKLTVHADKGQLQRIIAEGNPVQFSQQRENFEDIYGSSSRLEYEANTKRFILINHAELLQGKNRFSGQRIQFDPEQEKVIATGSDDNSENSQQRVQITIQPGSNDKTTDKK